MSPWPSHDEGRKQAGLLCRQNVVVQSIAHICDLIGSAAGDVDNFCKDVGRRLFDTPSRQMLCRKDQLVRPNRRYAARRPSRVALRP
jgi:hypothetical protein